MTLDFSEIEAKYAIKVPETFDNIVVVDNVPIVDSSKEEKLLNVIKKIFKSVGGIKENGIFMPKDAETTKSKGFMFIQFNTPEEAKQAIELGNGYKLDKSHILAVNAFDDIEAFDSMPDEYQEPVIEEFQTKEHLKSWLSDDRARDQFAIVKGEQTGIYWNNKAEFPDKVHEREKWSDRHIAWSPLGSYLVTLHGRGIALWGGPSWSLISRFVHPNVTLIDFSPNEKYLVTWSNESFKSVEGPMHNICVWDVLSGAMLRSFPMPQLGKDAKMDWPLLKWSHDDSYVARMTAGEQGVLYVYETPSMGLVNKKSIKVENLVDFSWSPTDTLISYWTPEIGNIPARVTLINIPTRNIVRTKNFFGVIECKLYWQPAGDYLLVKVDRNKTKTTTITSFEVFRMREKDIPVDVVEMKISEELTSLFWEPKGNKFAIIATENANTFIYFYEVQPSNAGSSAAAAVKILKHFEAKANTVKWSPKGRLCVIAGIRGLSGDLQFWDVEDMTLMATGEHYNCTDIEWDPTGRYVVSSVSSWHVQNDNGLTVWTLTGVELSKQNITGLKQFLWRPRPKTLLTAAEQKKIKKNLKEYSKEFDEEDAIQSNKASSEVQEKRRAQLASYRAFIAKFDELKEAEAERRVAVYGFDPYAPPVDEDRYVEVLIEETEEIVAAE
ncbi:Translation initiation factor 3 subunit b [Kappamyces sp. JEL0680]|nr:Translation initiation factor 3 subunit b [Kappamyces sp. JEL0680]